MITVKLELEELLVLADVLDRVQDDFSPWLYEELHDDGPRGYASVAMLQASSRLNLLRRKLQEAAPEPLEFCTATQSLRLGSQCEWRKHQAAQGASE